MGSLIFVGMMTVFAIWLIVKTAVSVPQQTVYLVENLGKYSKTLHAGFYILVPIVESIAYKISLKEQTINLPRQVCLTSDDASVEISAVLCLQVVDPMKAAYGVDSYLDAVTKSTQAAFRTAIAKVSLQEALKGNSSINTNIVEEVGRTAERWGVKILWCEMVAISSSKDKVLDENKSSIFSKFKNNSKEVENEHLIFKEDHSIFKK